MLVNSCQDRSYLYLLTMGWNIVNQFHKAQDEIGQHLKIIPLFIHVDNARFRVMKLCTLSIALDFQLYNCFIIYFISLAIPPHLCVCYMIYDLDDQSLSYSDTSAGRAVHLDRISDNLNRSTLFGFSDRIWVRFFKSSDIRIGFGLV